MAIRICQLITELRPSGAERVVYELSRRLDRGRFDVRVVGLQGGEVEQMLLAQGIPVEVLGVRGKWDVGKLRGLVRILRQWRIDLLHTHLFHADLAGRMAAVLADVPHLVHTVHVAEQRFRPWQYAYARLLNFRCDRIVCVSRSVRGHHAAHSHLPQSRYVVIPNGVDLPAWSVDAAARAWRATNGAWPRGRGRCFSSAGSITRRESTCCWRRSSGSVGADCSSFLPATARNGEWRKLSRRRIRELGVHLLGFVSDLRETFGAADLFVLPSRWEGWPLALAEAMAAGLPCIGANSPGIRDIIEDGKNGLPVPAKNPAALAEAIERVLADDGLARGLAAAGREHIRANFSIERNVAAHEALYEEICAPRASEPNP